MQPERIVTLKELIELEDEYKRQIAIRDNIIVSLEELHVDTVNHLLQVGGELDKITKLLWQSPMMHKNEHVV